ncbi:hypothetical protein [Virgibacillus sp. 7505]|uniref:hypothetical protein n=1 Tax=Virgibacillus sp. 7505 TaxID=2022548 RepID=UPI00113FD3CA|nr:hypothetical protein [Virgibacillus sp. 7505]
MSSWILSEMTGIPYGVLTARYYNEGVNDLLTCPVHSVTDRKRGVNNHKAKINDEIAMDIKTRLSKSEKAPEIASCYNISKYIVYDIKRSKTWKHVKIHNTEVTDRPSEP